MLPARLVIILLLFFVNGSTSAQHADSSKFRVIAFFTGRNDEAHISFIKEANQWFDSVASNNQFRYDTSSDWTTLNDSLLKKYDLVIFLDSRPPLAASRKHFENYMKNGGSWMGFHFSAFALTLSDFAQDWKWYHDEFLASGQYVSNTWRPTAAKLKTEMTHPVTKNLPPVFLSQPNEWYRWEHDLRKNKDVDILLSIDSSSFPLGTGPKPHEIWHEGYYPVVWSNRKYRMVYFNMGHNDIDYERATLKTLSKTFGNPIQDRLFMNALTWLTQKKMLQP